MTNWKTNKETKKKFKTRPKKVFHVPYILSFRDRKDALEQIKDLKKAFNETDDYDTKKRIKMLLVSEANRIPKDYRSSGSDEQQIRLSFVDAYRGMVLPPKGFNPPYVTEWNNYNYNTQQRVWMSPQKFLELSSPPVLGHTKEDPFAFSEHSVKGVKKAVIKEGEPLYALRLDIIPTGRVVGHEGRHRALTAIQEGWDYVPVILWHEDFERNLTPVSYEFPITELKTQSREYRFNALDVANKKKTKDGFIINGIEYKFHGAIPKNKPVPLKLKNEYDDVIEMSAIEGNRIFVGNYID